MCRSKAIATFRTAREVIKGDAACREGGVRVRVISVPSRLSSECGMCLEVEAGEIERFLELMHLHNIPIQLYDTPFV